MKQRSLNIQIFNNMFIESFVLTFLQWIFTFIVPNANEPLISHSVVVLSLFQMSPQSFKGNFEPLQKCLLLGIFLTDMWGSAKRICLGALVLVDAVGTPAKAQHDIWGYFYTKPGFCVFEGHIFGILLLFLSTCSLEKSTLTSWLHHFTRLICEREISAAAGLSGGVISAGEERRGKNWLQPLLDNTLDTTVSLVSSAVVGYRTPDGPDSLTY